MNLSFRFSISNQTFYPIVTDSVQFLHWAQSYNSVLRTCCFFCVCFVLWSWLNEIIVLQNNTNCSQKETCKIKDLPQTFKRHRSKLLYPSTKSRPYKRRPPSRSSHMVPERFYTEPNGPPYSTRELVRPMAGANVLLKGLSSFHQDVVWCETARRHTHLKRQQSDANILRIFSGCQGTYPTSRISCQSESESWEITFQRKKSEPNPCEKKTNRLCQGRSVAVDLRSSKSYLHNE